MSSDEQGLQLSSRFYIPSQEPLCRALIGPRVYVELVHDPGPEEPVAGRP